MLWCCSLTECCWLVHCAAVAGMGWPASSYQLELELELEMNKWHLSSGGDQIPGTSSGSVDGHCCSTFKEFFGFKGLLHLIGPAFSPFAVFEVLP